MPTAPTQPPPAQAPPPFAPLTAPYDRAPPYDGARPTGLLPSHPPPPGEREPDGMSGRLATGALVPRAPDVAQGGWRRMVYKVSRGGINPGPSADEVRRRRLVERVRTPLADCHRIAVLSLKGGVGKTTTTVGLGSTLASMRGDRVVAIDANPDRGTLGGKVPRQTRRSVRDLLDDADRLERYVDVRRYLSQAESRLEVLASSNNPEISREFADADYRAVDDVLQRHYSILLTDCGTGILHSAMYGVLSLADTLVVVGSSAVDGGSSASATLDWLEAHGYGDLVRQAVTVVSAIPLHGQTVDVDTLEQHFTARTRRVVTVPYDPALATGGPFDLTALRRPTRRAYLELAGAVAEAFDAGRP
jgi:MinD-like ATPase involved in chromosome partitioning or flagellar assembly